MRIITWIIEIRQTNFRKYAGNKKGRAESPIIQKRSKNREIFFAQGFLISVCASSATLARSEEHSAQSETEVLPK